MCSIRLRFLGGYMWWLQWWSRTKAEVPRVEAGHRVGTRPKVALKPGSRHRPWLRTRVRAHSQAKSGS